MELTNGHLLGGRLRYAQPRDGYRTGLEPVLLAASIPAQPGQRVLEAGTGAAAALLCLAARVPGLRAVGVEIDPAMADLARRNLRDNAIDTVEIITADITSSALGPFDHVFANPPWHDPRSTASPVAGRRRAKQEGTADLERWIEALACMLAPGGSLTLILPATHRDRATLAISRIGAVQVQPLLPKQDRPAKLLIIQAHKGCAQAEPDLAPIILHDATGAFTPEIQTVLREPSPLKMNSPLG